MRVAYVEVRESSGFVDSFGPQPRHEVDRDWESAMADMWRAGAERVNITLERTDDILRRAVFAFKDGWKEVLLIDDGSW